MLLRRFAILLKGCGKLLVRILRVQVRRVVDAPWTLPLA